MSELASIQIPRPADEQAFERCNEILWRRILNDPSVKLYGRRGQRQYGVDLIGIRNNDPDCIVGIQCKLKSDGHVLTKKEVLDEVEKALTFRPMLSEYHIVTTAPDDATIDALSHELSISKSNGRAKSIKIKVWGWGSMQREIARHPEALESFYPTFAQMTSLSDRIEAIPKEVSQEVIAILQPDISAISEPSIEALRVKNASSEALHSEQDRQIDEYMELIETEPATALSLLEKLEKRLETDAPNEIRFRLATNKAACQLALGKPEVASQGLIEIWNLAPENPKATANKALGLRLKEDWPELRRFAEEQLSEHPGNAPLASHYIHCLVRDEAIEEPLAHLPEEVRHTPDVMEAMVWWAMHRGKAGAWWAEAIAAHHRHPDHAELRNLYANALIDRVLNGSSIRRSQILTGDQRAEIQTAIQILEALWHEVREKDGHVRAEFSSVPVNLMVGLQVLGEPRRAIETGTDALRFFPDDVTLKEYLAVALADQGDLDRVSELLHGHEPNHRTFGVRIGMAVSAGDWRAVQRLIADHSNAIPDPEQSFMAAVGFRATVELAPQEGWQALLEEAVDRFSDDARALIMLCQCARSHNLTELATRYFECAISALAGSDNDFASRVAIADEAIIRREYALVVDLLLDRVPLDRESSELITLGHALVNHYPIRERALRFFQGLAPKIQALPVFRELEGALHFNRGAPEDAITPFSAAFDQEPNIGRLMCLIRAHFCTNNEEAIKALLQSAGIEDLPGLPLQLIELCQVMMDFGETNRALVAGYRAVCDGYREADTVLRFIGMVLNPNHRNTSSFDGVAKSGTWVRSVSEHDELWEGLIGDTDDRPWGQKANEDSSFVQQILGLSAKDTFTHTVAVTGVNEIWTIEEVKPTWLQAFHHLIKHFQYQFPENLAFARMTLPEGDVEPVLKQVRRYSEFHRERANLYLTRHVPMALVAYNEPGGAIAFAEYVRSLGEDVRVCIGTAEERAEAVSLIRDHECAGAVLDAFTAWHAAGMGILPILTKQLGPLAIPASEMQTLRHMAVAQRGQAGEESMRLDFRDGQYVRHIITGEEVKRLSAQIEERIETIERYCSVEPVVIPDTLSELGEALIQTPLSDFVAPAILAGDARLLLSEDMMLRRLAAQAWSVRGVWLQAALFNAAERSGMDSRIYSDCAVYLAAHRHGYVSMDIRVLATIFAQDDTSELTNLQILCNFIGTKDADVESHINLVVGFVNHIWSTGSPHDTRVKKATSILFRALLMPGRNDGGWVEWAVGLVRRLSSGPREFLGRWCSGHFLPVGEVLEKLRNAEGG